MNPLLRLRDYGQSYWLDNLTRDMIQSGELERRVRDQGLTGVTSNPAIFDKALAGSAVYDQQIRSCLSQGLDIPQIYEELTTKDVRDACDILRPVFDDTEGRDGFVSIEVSPHLAFDTKGSIAEAQRLHAKVDRPNVFIKIPGTPEGAVAVEELLYQGLNINITLLFSIPGYQAVAEAHLSALERRLNEDMGVKEIASVASFFLSRIDVLVDQQLHPLPTREGKDPRQLLGKAAVANAKLAYQAFKANLNDNRWRRAAKLGARPQRMLWASTSTKTPGYSDVMYVEPLIGAHTVNTMPDATIAAFADHGKVANTIEQNLEDARRVMEELAAVGIDFDAVTAQLLREAVQKFIEPYDTAMELLRRKCESL